MRPPQYPDLLYNAPGREYLQAKSPALAAQAFETSLALALSGLIKAHDAPGNP